MYCIVMRGEVGPSSLVLHMLRVWGWVGSTSLRRYLVCERLTSTLCVPLYKMLYPVTRYPLLRPFSSILGGYQERSKVSPLIDFSTVSREGGAGWPVVVSCLLVCSANWQGLTRGVCGCAGDSGWSEGAGEVCLKLSTANWGSNHWDFTSCYTRCERPCDALERKNKVWSGGSVAPYPTWLASLCCASASPMLISCTNDAGTRPCLPSNVAR